MTFSNYTDEQCRLLLEKLWNHCLIGLAIVDRDGSFVKVNPTFCRFLGYSEAELVTKSFRDVTLPEDVEWDLAMAQKVLAGEINGYDMPKRYLTKFHNVIKALLRVTGVMKNNQFIFFISQATLIENTVTETEAPHKPTLWHKIRANWAVITVVAAGFAAFAAKVIEVWIKN